MVRASEALISASLLLTTVTVLFGLWRDDIEAAERVSVPAHLQDAAKERRIVGDAIRYRVWPLLISTWVVMAAFLPVAISEAVKSAQNTADKGWSAWRDYDPAAVAMAGVVSLLAILGLTLASRLLALRKKRDQLRLPGRGSAGGRSRTKVDT